ncbi:putative secreted protein [Streptomyces davaonensis JCM 4913]|uniref:Putative secreted protein n=1 Tax=Streptomyces davaonensis (strain DSM 101723 / JCM 4913 / KCC S-0913 / 768) TaxID=1214101 RepID=K4QW89_STRDJ|nr:putative secreted protein [Streptomyces davaonensis JCM 4913]
MPNPHSWQQWLGAMLIAAGWILATTIAAGLTRTLARR